MAKPSIVQQNAELARYMEHALAMDAGEAWNVVERLNHQRMRFAIYTMFDRARKTGLIKWVDGRWVDGKPIRKRKGGISQRGTR